MLCGFGRREELFAFHLARSEPIRSTKGDIMADSSPLADLLDRAGEVFTLAGGLGRAFQKERTAPEGVIDSSERTPLVVKPAGSITKVMSSPGTMAETSAFRM